jgi:hypothetical protein
MLGPFLAFEVRKLTQEAKNMPKSRRNVSLVGQFSELAGFPDTPTQRVRSQYFGVGWLLKKT